jgi:hypothetical protein
VNGSGRRICSSYWGTESSWYLRSAMARRSLIRLFGKPHRVAVLVYLVTTSIYLLVAPHAILREHTACNHFALLAQSWLSHRLDLGAPPPAYTGLNDFAFFHERWFVVFPGVPALLILPWVMLAGSAERTPDGLFFLLLAGIGPAGMFLTLDRIGRERLAAIGRATVLALVSLYAFGTVYFFSAVQGTVWFAAHIVAAGATGFFLYAALAARCPLGAGVALALAVGTRPVLGALGLFFLLEWWRVDRRRGRLVVFVLPVVVTLVVLALHNWARFGNPTEFGYRYLKIAWQARIEKWGLFGYHYLARNLGLVLTSLPIVEHGPSGWSLRVNGHGLALWVTTPPYLWLLWPRQKCSIHRAVYVALGGVALPSLLYQNSGWLQFGQRFSNDYAPLLIVLLAIGGYQWSRALKVAWSIALGVNLFGAVTFGRTEYADCYFIDRTQRVIYPLD